MPGQRAPSPGRVAQRQPSRLAPKPASSGQQAHLETAATPSVGHDFGGVHVNAPGRVSLPIGAADGLHEQQANQVADQIARTAAPAPTATDGPRVAPPIVHDVLASPGQPLDAATRAYMEPRLGHDFGHVRIHSDETAERSARAIDARAFTLGEHIVFGDRRRAPGSADGTRLLAHELAHVVQQAAQPGLAVLARQPAPRGTDSPTNPDDVARALAKKLQAGKRADVLRDLQALKPQDLVALDAAAVKVLPAHDAEPLRRVIHFVQLPAPTNQTVVTVDQKSGVDVPKAGAKVGAGAVTVKTGASASAGAAGKTDSAYVLTYAGSDANEMRWLQFAWREIVPEFAVKGAKPRRAPAQRKLEHSGQIYHLTTDPVQPSWNTDTGTSRSPFFEQDTTTNRSASELVLVDFPSPMDSLVGELFANQATPPSRVVSHFHAATYLLKGMDVVYRADVDLSWDYSDAKHKTMTSSAKGKPTTQLEAVHRTRLLVQFPGYGFVPGPVAAAPEPQSEFDIVRDVVPSGSLTEAEWSDPKRSDVERFADIAKLADVYNLVDVVSGTSTSAINVAGKVPGGTLKPGLNYSSQLRTTFPDAPSGETGYLDSNDVYHNPDLPAERDGKLPRIVIILGPNAFTRGKAYALATLRHEMAHALHEQLALGWLVKWRDEQPNQSFKDWLAAQAKSNKLSPLEAALIESGSGGTTAGTEMLAWTEGLVTALPFLPAVDVDLVQTDARYPAAVSALRGAGKNYNLIKGSTNEAAIQAALKRVRTVCSTVLSQAQRDLLVEWIDFLLDPASRKPIENTLKLTVANFGPLKDFLTEVRGIAMKAKASGKRTP